jgi:hypothetical protein
MSFSALVIVVILIMPQIALAQQDTAAVNKAADTLTTDSVSAIAKTDTAKAIAVVTVDSAAIKKIADTATAVVVATPMNCYKQWMDAFAERGVKPLTDGMQEVVIAFKSKESCHCYMGKVEIADGKLKAPLYVQTEGGEFKTFVEMGKKLDPDFLVVQGDALWNVTNGMSALFQTVDQEYGRVFFYKTLNKNKTAKKEAPSPADLLNN